MTTFEMQIGSGKWELRAVELQYDCGQKAIAIDGRVPGQEYFEPFGTLTIAIPQAKLGPDEIIVKNWSENEGWADQVARKLGYIKTTRYVRTGFVEAFIWEKV